MLENEHPRAKTVPIQPKAVQFLPSFSEQLTKLIDFVSLTNLPVFRREAALREEAAKKEAVKREATVTVKVDGKEVADTEIKIDVDACQAKYDGRRKPPRTLAAL